MIDTTRRRGLPAAVYARKKKVKPCTAKIHHGPGHQSETHCHNTKKYHRIHEAYYGCHSQYARWKGQEVCSGYFDEPPQGDSDE